MSDPSIPSFLIPVDGAKIHMTIPNTNAVVTEQGYTYNQAGFTYNQPGVTYGGVTNPDTDIVPMLEYADPTTPHAMFFSEVKNITQNKANKNAPGFFMFLNLS